VWNFTADLIKKITETLQLLNQAHRENCMKGSSWPKKHGWVGQKPRWYWLYFSIGKHCPSWICTTWSEGKQLYHEVFSAFEGCCAKTQPWILRKPDLDVAPRQCAGLGVATIPQFSSKTSDIHCVPSFLFFELSSSRTFPVQQLKTTLKVRRFQTTKETQQYVTNPTNSLCTCSVQRM
jgi:hypothetical protein